MLTGLHVHQVGDGGRGPAPSGQLRPASFAPGSPSSPWRLWVLRPQAEGEQEGEEGEEEAAEVSTPLQYQYCMS